MAAISLGITMAVTLILKQNPPDATASKPLPSPKPVTADKPAPIDINAIKNATSEKIVESFGNLSDTDWKKVLNAYEKNYYYFVGKKDGALVLRNADGKFLQISLNESPKDNVQPPDQEESDERREQTKAHTAEMSAVGNDYGSSRLIDSVIALLSDEALGIIDDFLNKLESDQDKSAFLWRINMQPKGIIEIVSRDDDAWRNLLNALVVRGEDLQDQPMEGN